MDYEIIHEEGQYQVWTPDESGAVIGSGGTELDAIADAIKNMRELIQRMEVGKK